MAKVVLGVGSNINREENILSGLESLQEFVSAFRTSSTFESPAFGFYGANFFNLVVSGECHMSLRELAARLREIEYEHGRLPDAEKFSSRYLDIDILLYGDKCGECDGVKLPRSEILEQAYVLRPLAELEPSMCHPELNTDFDTLWAQFQGNAKLWRSDFQVIIGSVVSNAELA
ncbi:MAG: 2-amino-4-hydroxy-6-hydroxymethyldihydropteridine diphosphokinase [Agarilytica sp.]